MPNNQRKLVAKLESPPIRKINRRLLLAPNEVTLVPYSKVCSHHASESISAHFPIVKADRTWALPEMACIKGLV